MLWETNFTLLNGQFPQIYWLRKGGFDINWERLRLVIDDKAYKKNNVNISFKKLAKRI